MLHDVRFVTDELSKRLVPDELWNLAEPLLPEFTPRPQGGGTTPTDERAVFTAGRSCQPAPERFESGSEAEDLIEIARAPALGLHAAVALISHKPLRGQAPEGLPHRCPAQSERFGDLAFAQPLTTAPLAGQDRPKSCPASRSRPPLRCFRSSANTNARSPRWPTPQCSLRSPGTWPTSKTSCADPASTESSPFCAATRTGLGLRRRRQPREPAAVRSGRWGHRRRLGRRTGRLPRLPDLRHGRFLHRCRPGTGTFAANRSRDPSRRPHRARYLGRRPHRRSLRPGRSRTSRS